MQLEVEFQAKEKIIDGANMLKKKHKKGANISKKAAKKKRLDRGK